MTNAKLPTNPTFDRRSLLALAASAVAATPLTRRYAVAAEGDDTLTLQPPTNFQIACMTLPYQQFSFDRALKGLRSAGYEFVAWGTRHTEASGERTPVMPTDASPARAKELAARCRGQGLEPVMMFSTIYPEAKDGLKVLKQRILQAEAAGIGQVLTFGHTKGGNRSVWIDRFKQLGPFARDHNVLLVVKQHGGSTGTGAACAEIVREVDDTGIMVNYDAGNVMDYLNVDPIPDIQKCVDVVRSFCIKDHRNWPKDQDCGPGLGEIDHYRLLHPVAFTGRTIPLCCENIFAPLVKRPTEPDQIDALARRARLFLETVIAGLHA